MTLQMDVRTGGQPDGRGYHNIPDFYMKSTGIIMTNSADPD